MTDSQLQEAPDRTVSTGWSAEKIAWWVVFGVLTLGTFALLGM